MTSKTVVWLWVLAALAPLVCVIVGGWLFWNMTSRPGRFMDEPAVTVMQAIIVALPFVFLAAIAPLKLRTSPETASRGLAAAALIGFVVTAAIWTIYYYSGYVSLKSRRTGGANIGAGMLMLASPFIAGSLMALAFRLSRRR